MSLETDWKKVVTDPTEKLVFEALADATWEWRTLGALFRVSKLSEAEVRRILNQYPQLVRKSKVPSENGEDLYTLQERYFERQSPIQKWWHFTSTSSSSN